MIQEEDEDEWDEQGEEEPQEEDEEVEVNANERARVSGQQTEPEDVSKQSTATEKEACGDKATPTTPKAEVIPSNPDPQAAPSNPDPKAPDVGSNVGELTKQESGKEIKTKSSQVEESKNKQRQAAAAAEAPTNKGSCPANSILALALHGKIFVMFEMPLAINRNY